MNKQRIISIDLNTGPYTSFVEHIMALGRAWISSYVCVANVHMVVEAYKSPVFADVVNDADLVTPDGMPLVKGLKLLYGTNQERVAGMDLLPDLLRAAEQDGQSIFIYGSTDNVLQAMTRRVAAEHPHLKVAGAYSPPFRPLSDEEDCDIVKRINASSANLVFVALGCPKQEMWMAHNKGKINAVMLGVGGAFPVYAGLQKRAPLWAQNASLEWLYRLCQEPRRLFRRYLVTNTTFVLLMLWEMVKSKRQF
ncbi:MAG: WecB/TagA/CpsF family glycosyltransferase [Desulfuromonadaceae bacterium]